VPKLLEKLSEEVSRTISSEGSRGDWYLFGAFLAFEKIKRRK
jgi:hypothetical protein